MGMALDKGIGKTIVGMLNLKVKADGVDAMSTFSGWLGKIRDKFVNLGVTAIFLDRLLMTLRRTWDALSEAVGATRVSEQAREFYDFAKMLNLGTTEFQAFTVVSRQFGANIRDVVDMFGQMQERITDFRGGNKQIAGWFKGTGINAKSFEGKSVIERFKMISDVLQKVDPDTAQSIMQSFFGEEGSRQFGPWAMRGPQSVVDMMKEAIDLGAVMTEQQIKLGRAYAVEQNRLGMVFTALGNNFALMVMPALGAVSEFIFEIIGRLAKFFKIVGPTVGDKLLNGTMRFLDVLRSGIAWFDTNVMPFEEFLVRIGHGLAGVTVLLFGIFNMMQAMGVIAMLKAAFVVALLFDSLFTKLRGGRSFIDTLLKSSPAFKVFAGGLVMLWKLAMLMVTAFGTFFSTLMQSYVGLTLFVTIGSIIGGMLAGITAAVRMLTAALLIVEAVLEAIASIITVILGGLVWLVDGKMGKRLIESGRNLGIGAMQSMGHAFEALVRPSGSNFGGYTNMGFQQALGPDATKLLYGNGAPINVTQVNNVNIPTTANADDTKSALDKLAASQLKAALEKAQAAGGRK